LAGLRLAPSLLRAPFRCSVDPLRHTRDRQLPSCSGAVVTKAQWHDRHFIIVISCDAARAPAERRQLPMIPLTRWVPDWQDPRARSRPCGGISRWSPPDESC